MSRIRIHVVASIILFSASVHGASPDLNQHGLTGSWYDPTKTGQGIEVFPDLVASGTSPVQGAWFTDCSNGTLSCTFTDSATTQHLAPTATLRYPAIGLHPQHRGKASCSNSIQVQTRY